MLCLLLMELTQLNDLKSNMVLIDSASKIIINMHWFKNLAIINYSANERCLHNNIYYSNKIIASKIV
jgi:hypothetical protein